jgi:hypothetical protein
MMGTLLRFSGQWVSLYTVTGEEVTGHFRTWDELGILIETQEDGPKYRLMKFFPWSRVGCIEKSEEVKA